MASTYTYNTNHNSLSSQRGVAMALALVSAVALSPLYVSRKNNDQQTKPFYEIKLNSSFILPMVLGGLIIAIRTTSSSSLQGGGRASSIIPSPDPSWVLRIGSSSWGLAGVLVMLMLVLSWQGSVQDFFWR